MASLIVTTGKLKGKHVQILEDEVFIGRDETCKIRIASKEVSREHCLIMRQGKDILVRDLNSRNGTFVNGMVINGVTPLAPGDTLHIGPMIFELSGSKKPVGVGGRKASIGNLRTDRHHSASDNDIAHWLNDEDQLPIVDGDTTLAGRDVIDSLAERDTDPANELDAKTTMRPMTATLTQGAQVAQGDPQVERMMGIIKHYWQSKVTSS